MKEQHKFISNTTLGAPGSICDQASQEQAKEEDRPKLNYLVVDYLSLIHITFNMNRRKMNPILG